MTAHGSARLLAVSLIATAPSVEAGQPLVTDDAAILAPGTCQLEAWSHSMHDGREVWAQPACNVTGNLELSVGAARAHRDAGEPANIVQLQAKSLLSARAGDAWSFGTVAGGARDTGAPRGASPFQTYYAKVLASWHSGTDLQIDINLGAANVYGSGTFAVAGAALQYAVVTNVQLLAEAFRDEPGRAKYQVGLRYILIPDRFETYASYGNRFSGSFDQRSVIIGIRVQDRIPRG
jgi:hypothetical protein